MCTCELLKANKTTNLRALFSIFIEKKAAQVGLEPTTSSPAFTELVGFKLNMLCKAKHLISPDKHVHVPYFLE